MAIKSAGPKGHAEKLFGGSDAKGAKAQHLLSGQKSTLTGGDPMSRMMGQYGKGHSYLTPGEGSQNEGSDPQAHPGMSNPGRSSNRDPNDPQIRGSAGGIRSRPQSGGLAEGKMSAPLLPMGD